MGTEETALLAAPDISKLRAKGQSGEVAIGVRRKQPGQRIRAADQTSKFTSQAAISDFFDPKTVGHNKPRAIPAKDLRGMSREE
jgi:hypothetical protein